MSTHNEINGPVHGTALQVGSLHQHVEHPRGRTPAIAFYYPYIHVRDDTWLKYAAMYWPKITRLVPRGYETADSPTAREFVRAGVLARLPRVSALGGHYNDFFPAVLSRAAEFRARYGVARRGAWVFRAARRSRSISAGPGTDPKLTYLHYDKLDPEVIDQLIAKGLGKSHGNSWLGMHPDLAAVYMCLLADHLARHESLHPLTDEALPHDALLEQDANRIAEVLLGVPPRPRHQDATQSFVTAAVHTVVPDGLAGVPAEKILELRESFPKDFRRFREHVGDRFTELRADSTTRLHLDVALDDLVRAELADLEDRLRSVKLVPRRVRVWLKADPVRESPVGWLFRAGQALR
ncbi:hypothetical protein SAMN05216188_10390 [Lentzea xinjiangensis]|uniref:Uncharacterized protein n=1 Tax=Lentzea xinjiangensis TaxID=402600 RepID=A0A1H9G613_9PSEU|nr:DUF6236 family protein [Lentzea xinjiangensis]SEQ45557.1 hypothetical protein SAMN05216188_10390 [Lentzea xinjiangensis]